MSNYFSNLLTNTTSKYNSLRRTLLSNEEDGDTEDDSHVSRVLRTYYTEKGRPFPPWLPPDPNDKRAITPSPYQQPSSSSNYFPGSSMRSYGQQGRSQSQASSRSNLSDLWDSGPGGSNNTLQPQSLRNARPGGIGTRPTSNPGLAPPFSATAASSRPLPSQRIGSQTSMLSSQSNGSGGAAGVEASPPRSGGGTAQDRLKARLWGGGRAASPAAGQSAYEQQQPQQQQGGGGGGNRRFGQIR